MIRNYYEHEKIAENKIVEKCRCIYGKGKRSDTTTLLIREGIWWFGESRSGEVPPEDEWVIPASPGNVHWMCITDHPFVVKKVRYGVSLQDFKTLSNRRKSQVAAYVWEREWRSNISMGVQDLRMILPYLETSIQQWVLEELGDPQAHNCYGKYGNYIPAADLASLEAKLGRPAPGYKARPVANWRNPSL